jgi:deoxyribonuclease V
MIAAMDVSYRDGLAVAACVIFGEWTSNESVAELRERIEEIEPYQPGKFYRRELPCFLALCSRSRQPIDVVIIDGYVWLGPENSPGLGAHLYWAFGKETAVIGVAKTPFKGSPNAQRVLRGGSRRPLYVTAAGIDPHVAAKNIEQRHGPHRIPTLLKKVDRLCRAIR